MCCIGVYTPCSLVEVHRSTQGRSRPWSRPLLERVASASPREGRLGLSWRGSPPSLLERVASASPREGRLGLSWRGSPRPLLERVASASPGEGRLGLSSRPPPGSLHQCGVLCPSNFFLLLMYMNISIKCNILTLYLLCGLRRLLRRGDGDGDGDGDGGGGGDDDGEAQDVSHLRRASLKGRPMEIAA
jgi:hypothetical protein